MVGGATGSRLSSSMLGRWLINWPTKASPSTIVAAVAVSAMVGIDFGFYPARKGSHSDPIVDSA
jgi:hypothetical protein